MIAAFRSRSIRAGTEVGVSLRVVCERVGGHIFRLRDQRRPAQRYRRPCLWFDGQAEPAAAHYTAIFPAAEILGVTHYGPKEHGVEGAVMTQAMLGMAKIEIAELQRAADQASA